MNEQNSWPRATYRLQMHKDFTLKNALEIVPYLDDLGISHLYMSSLLTAKPGSLHGYDVCDHKRLNPELGTEEDLQKLSDELKSRGMGLILDVVPNHMSVGCFNSWWHDVLENGPSSQFSNYFDIVWDDHYRESLRGKVLLPILGTTYGEAVDSGAFQAVVEEGNLYLKFGKIRLPIDPRTYGAILEPTLESLRDSMEEPETVLPELQSIISATKHLSGRMEKDSQKVLETRNEIVVIKRRLLELGLRSPAFQSEIETQFSLLAKDPNQLDKLIELQAYRPCFWRVASDEINYRRFFDINDLAALATERLEVFQNIHEKIFKWLHADIAQGIRIDHPDGLFDPKRYLARLQDEWRQGGDRPTLYVVVEKILGTFETLPKDWQTDGTTGYEFLNYINGLFVDSAAEARIDQIFQSFTGIEDSFEEIVYRKKMIILQSSLTSELHVLAGYLDRLAQSERSTRDLTLNGIRHALREVLCSFPIYRTYIDGDVQSTDRVAVLKAIRAARRRNPLLGREIFDFIRDTLLLKPLSSGTASQEYRSAQIRFAGKFQQLSAPVMAKGFEDTALYIYTRLISLNEVGGDPMLFGRSPDLVHKFLGERSPGGLSPLATHDTKRGEDTRARINVLSEIPDEWNERSLRWSQMNDRHRVALEDHNLAPDRNEENLLYQTLIGSWPVNAAEERQSYSQRICDYMIKAMQEAKVHTSWINPDQEYLEAVQKFIERILDPDQSSEFMTDFQDFIKQIHLHGQWNSLAQTLLRCTAPGIPDTYQGTELWDYSLVDPDNRRPVDFSIRQDFLKEFQSDQSTDTIQDLLKNSDSGKIKILLIARCLKLRKEWPELFSRGDYQALKVKGAKAENIFAYLRTWENLASLIVVPRLTWKLNSARKCEPFRAEWEETTIELPEHLLKRNWRNYLTNESLKPVETFSVQNLLESFPCCLAIAQ